MRLGRYRTDYGRGPAMWFITTQGGMRACTVGECLRHPIRAFRYLVQGISS